LGLADGMAWTAASNSTSVFSKFFSSNVSTMVSSDCFATP
jgi:hypothetical protein